MINRYIHAIDFLFFILVATLIFVLIPKPISLELLGKTGKEFAIYPLCISMIVTTYAWRILKKEKGLFNSLDWNMADEVHTFSSRGKWYIGLLFIILSISVISGVVSYPYYEQILGNDKFFPNRLVHVMAIFHLDDISRAEIWLWLIIKGLKNVFLDTVLLFGGAALIYLWYGKRSARCFNLLIKGIFVSIGVIFLYELVELPYLLGNQTATHILTVINPYIHQIGHLNNYYVGNSNAEAQAYSWWPPLLWKHQVRSVFPEPSFFGLYCAFAMPWIWYAWFQIQKKYLISVKGITLFLVMLFLDFLVFATQARTAILLFIGELALLVLYGIYQTKKEYWEKIVAIIFLTIIAFSGSLLFSQVEKNGFSITEDYTLENETASFLKKAGENYVSQNIASAVGKDQRSNRARFSLMEAELKVWMEHPFFGVGEGLKGAYIPEKLPSDATESSEVRMWLDRLHANGALKASFPDVSEYTSKLCEIGLLGCLLYYFPIIYLVYYFMLFLYKSRRYKQHFKTQELIFFYLISLSGILVGGVSTSLGVNYCFGILLGIGFVLYQQTKQQTKNSKNLN